MYVCKIFELLNTDVHIYIYIYIYTVLNKIFYYARVKLLKLDKLAVK